MIVIIVVIILVMLLIVLAYTYKQYRITSDRLDASYDYIKSTIKGGKR